MTIVDVRKIWDKGNHNAFTDLVRFKGRWYCTFREGKGHVSPDGALRVLASDDGDKWVSVALITSDNADLRDSKLSVTPENKLLLLGTDSWHGDEAVRRQTRAWLSEDGKIFTGGGKVADPNYWLWRVSWRNGKGYGFGYHVKDPRGLRLYVTTAGKAFDTHVKSITQPGYPNESSILFRENGEALCLLRRDPQPAMLGESKPPYKEWSWNELDRRVGGPHLIELPDGRLIAVVRLYDGGARTSICRLDRDAGNLVELKRLPSGGDTSYAGLVYHDGLLWISYYASHEGKTSIYLAKVKFAPVAP